MGFSSQKYWSGLPFSSSGDLSDPGIEPSSPALQEDSLSTEPLGMPKILMLVNGRAKILKMKVGILLCAFNKDFLPPLTLCICFC